MKYSTFITLDDTDRIARSTHSPSTIYVGDALTLSGTTSALARLRNALIAVTADLEAAPQCGGDS